MTCIVGCVDELGIVYMGGDSACCNDEELYTQAHSKVVKKMEILIGCAGSMKVSNIILRTFIPPVYRPEKKDLLSFLVMDFTRAMKQALNDAGESGEQLENNSMLLVGLHGRLFQIESRFQVLEAACRYEAIGTGAHFALGAMHVTVDLPSPERISRALTAAEAHCPTVRSPFTLERLEPCYHAPPRRGFAYGFR